MCNFFSVNKQPLFFFKFHIDQYLYFPKLISTIHSKMCKNFHMFSPSKRKYQGWCKQTSGNLVTEKE